MVKMAKPPSPSLSDLAAWRADKTTQWVLLQCHQGFPSQTGPRPLISQEDVMTHNFYAGANAVFDKIRKITDGQ